jgi:hypothetical protein
MRYAMMSSSTEGSWESFRTELLIRGTRQATHLSLDLTIKRCACNKSSLLLSTSMLEWGHTDSISNKPYQSIRHIDLMKSTHYLCLIKLIDTNMNIYHTKSTSTDLP